MKRKKNKFATIVKQISETQKSGCTKKLFFIKCEKIVKINLQLIIHQSVAYNSNEYVLGFLSKLFFMNLFLIQKLNKINFLYRIF